MHTLHDHPFKIIWATYNSKIFSTAWVYNMFGIYLFIYYGIFWLIYNFTYSCSKGRILSLHVAVVDWTGADLSGGEGVEVNKLIINN